MGIRRSSGSVSGLGTDLRPVLIDDLDDVSVAPSDGEHLSYDAGTSTVVDRGDYTVTSDSTYSPGIVHVTVHILQV